MPDLMDRGILWLEGTRMDSWSKNELRVRVLYSVGAVGTQIFISTNESFILVDAGDGVLRDLLSIGFKPERLDAILITHGHYDHVGGLHTLLGYFKMKKRNRSLPVFLPRGCLQASTLLKNFSNLYSGFMPYVVEAKELDDRDCFTAGSFRAWCNYVVHCTIEPDGKAVPMPAAGYRIDDGKTIVAVTGDCGDSESVRDLVKDADLALVEANLKSYTSELQRKVHLTEALAEEIGSLAREHILIHKLP
ncbi:ribonuclease Z [candidate division TA06 bacterium]|uniref:Ribonuclease Z n=1 Tax=candidate division TA06 bacterium TaxID=2250710 RepID=A0A523XWQ8_UNCT6|nr:MAG: ribonuclease Z [candidate division TA06 bacterium]